MQRKKFAVAHAARSMGCMKRVAIIGGAAALVALVVVLFFYVRRSTTMTLVFNQAPGETKVIELSPQRSTHLKVSERADVAPEASAAEKAARVEAIRRDYEELRRKVAGELAAIETATVGDAKVLLRQLALLEGELRADLARVLDAAELEDFELRESTTGVRVTQRLAGATATEAQRRAVFRVQREFDLKHALAFELSAEALAVRERDRRETEQKIRAVLGEELFAAWSSEAR